MRRCRHEERWEAAQGQEPILTHTGGGRRRGGGGGEIAGSRLWNGGQCASATGGGPGRLGSVRLQPCSEFFFCVCVVQTVKFIFLETVFTERILLGWQDPFWPIRLQLRCCWRPPWFSGPPWSCLWPRLRPHDSRPSRFCLQLKVWKGVGRRRQLVRRDHTHTHQQQVFFSFNNTGFQLLHKEIWAALPLTVLSLLYSVCTWD